MIKFNDLSMQCGAKLLFSDVNLFLLAGRRYGVVGANGSGKSTLLKLIANDESPETGSLTLPNSAVIGTLKQDQYQYESDRIIDVVIQGNATLWQALTEKETLLENEICDHKTGLRLAALEEIIAHQEGYAAQALAGELLIGLGIPKIQHDNPLSTLSGGYKLRVLLAQALFKNPTILLLDEPTNHLDIMTTFWLETYLINQYKGLLLVVSHDVRFLNQISTHILDLDYGEILQYSGNYNAFLKEKKLIVEQKLHQTKHIERKIAHLQKFVDRFGAKASKAKQANARQKMIEKMILPDIQKTSRIRPHIHFEQAKKSGKKILDIQHLSKHFDNKPVLNKINLKVHRGEKVGFIGHNGIGKSTLLKIILGQLQPSFGEVETGHQVEYGYFSQDHHEQLYQNQSILAWLSAQVSNASEASIRNLLGQMLFSKNEVHKNIQTLSGGESARLLISKLMLEQKNVLVFDEPTNHLDIESIEALADALKIFPGTILLVTHDRYFLSKIVNRIVALTEKGIKDFHGHYTDYVQEVGEDYLFKACAIQ